jgi:hypothetical protein
MYTHRHAHAHTCSHTVLYIHTYICIYIYIYIYVSIHPYIHTYIHRYTALTKSGASSSGGELARFSKDIFMNGAFGRLVYYLTGVSVLGGRTQVRRFRPGLDYSVASG